jgi:hypothetical protein
MTERGGFTQVSGILFADDLHIKRKTLQSVLYECSELKSMLVFQT